MPSFSSLVTLVAALAWAPAVLAHPASPLQLAVIKEQFKNAKLVPDAIPTFDPTGTLVLNFTKTVQRTAVGQVISKENATTDAPVLIIRGSAESEATANGPFNVTTIKYTVLGFDANVPGANSTGGWNLHYLQNDLVYGVNSDHSVTLNITTAARVAYAPPNPPVNSGPHRYTFLAYAQPAEFTVPATPAANSSVQRFDLASYVKAAKLGDPIAGTYFTVEVGTANVTVASTTAVDSTTLPQYTPPATSSSGASGSATGTATGASPSQPGSGASSIGASLGAVGLIAGVLSLHSLF